MAKTQFKEIQLSPSMFYVDVFIQKDRKKLLPIFNKRYGASEEYYDEKMSLDSVFDINCIDKSICRPECKSTCEGHLRIVMVLESNAPYILVHELIHVLWHAAEAIGYGMNYESQEWQAVLYEYLFTECTKNDFKKI